MNTHNTNKFNNLENSGGGGFDANLRQNSFHDDGEHSDNDQHFNSDGNSEFV
jgi:hypothetical protein